MDKMRMLLSGLLALLLLASCRGPQTVNPAAGEEKTAGKTAGPSAAEASEETLAAILLPGDEPGAARTSDGIWSRPPQLVLQADGERYVLPSGSAEWNYLIDQDKRSGLIACGMAPLQIDQLTEIKVPKGGLPVQIEAALMPDKIEVRRWPLSWRNQMDKFDQYETVRVQGTAFTLSDDGDYIYAVQAYWQKNERNYGHTESCFATVRENGG